MQIERSRLFPFSSYPYSHAQTSLLVCFSVGEHGVLPLSLSIYSVRGVIFNFFLVIFVVPFPPRLKKTNLLDFVQSCTRRLISRRKWWACVSCAVESDAWDPPTSLCHSLIYHVPDKKNLNPQDLLDLSPIYIPQHNSKNITIYFLTENITCITIYTKCSINSYGIFREPNKVASQILICDCVLIEILWYSN